MKNSQRGSALVAIIVVGLFAILGAYYFLKANIDQQTNNNLETNNMSAQVATPTVSSASITVVSPNGSEVLVTKSSYLIKWSSKNLGTSKVKINLYKNNVFVYTIANNLANTGTYTWSISSSTNPASTYKISIVKVGNENVKDSSNTSFTIIAPISAPPESLKLNSSYKKYLNAEGIPIISSSNVTNAGLYAAAKTINMMLVGRQDIRTMMIKKGAYFAVIGRTEKTTSLPEYYFLDSTWDQRARGFGATLSLPLTSAGEENLLKDNTDVYRGDDIAIHEFSHSIHVLALDFIDPTFSSRLQSIYNSAMSKGLWENTYAATDYKEYWAEGVQDWFNANLEAIPTNGIHNSVNTKSELKTYDPDLYNLIASVFSSP